MDIPSFLATYGGPGGIVGVAVWLLLSDRRHSSERRAELREDIDREQADNARLRSMVRDRDKRIIELEAQLRRCERGEG